MKRALIITVALMAATPVMAFRGKPEINWTDELAHSVPAWELHCVLETFTKEGFDAELLRMGIKQDDPRVQAIRSYCAYILIGAVSSLPDILACLLVIVVGYKPAERQQIEKKVIRPRRKPGPKPGSSRKLKAPVPVPQLKVVSNG